MKSNKQNLEQKNFCVLPLLIVAAILLTSVTAHAAFCSLRDPVSAIQNLYDDDSQYRSIVAIVTEDDRSALKLRLPFTLHQSEVGKHTLYVVFDDETPKGFVQARSEWAKWGLIEIAWAINMDRTIKDFYFQRCRSSQCNETTQQRIVSIIQNKDFYALKSLLSDDGKALSETGKTAFSEAPVLALLTVQSALKTLAITDISWKQDLEKLSFSE